MSIHCYNIYIIFEIKYNIYNINGIDTKEPRNILRKIPGIENNQELVNLACEIVTSKATKIPSEDITCEKAAMAVWRAVHFGESVCETEKILTCYTLYELLRKKGVQVSFEKWKAQYYGFLQSKTR